MAGNFPTLKSGNTVWYPLEDTQSFGTGLVKFLDDTEQRWRARRMLRRLKLICQDINAYDSSLILTFWRSQFGMFDSTWSITIGSSTYNNCSFSSDTYQLTENKRNRHTLAFDVIQVITDGATIPAAKPYFPQINNVSGTMTMLPYTAGYDYRTTSIDLPSGKRFAWKWRSNPLGRYALNLSNITDAELTVVRDFFYSMEGRKGEFGMLDPGGNLVPFSDLYSDSSWTKNSLSIGSAQTDPFGGNLATRLTATGSNADMHCTIIPAGNASGFLFVASCWARAVSANQSLSIGFRDNSLTDLGGSIIGIPQGVWKRVFVPNGISTNSPIVMQIGGFGVWGAGNAIDIFGAQVSPLFGGPGPRLITPGFDGYRAKCRFDTDDFVVNHQQVNSNSITLPIQEYK